MGAQSVSVVIPTYNRSAYIGNCLRHVLDQSTAPREVVVVDASPGNETEAIVRAFPEVTYLRSDHGRGTTATSRAIGLEHVTADVVAFLDDDALPEPTWLENLLARYVSPEVAGVGGRAINGQHGEEHVGVDAIGQLRSDGSLTGYFSAVPDRDVEVDHMLGANMSMRVQVIKDLGGIRDYYPGTCLREESDIALRARVAGYKLIYTPEAVVRHLGGTYAKGERFDRRYEYYAARNHMVLLKTALPSSDPRIRASYKAIARKVGGHLRYASRSLAGRTGGSPNPMRGTVNGLSRAAAQLAGAAAGYVAAERHRRKTPDSPPKGRDWR